MGLPGTDGLRGGTAFGECEEFTLYSKCIGGVESTRRIGWLAFGGPGRTQPVLRGERAISSIGRLFAEICPRLRLRSRSRTPLVPLQSSPTRCPLTLPYHLRRLQATTPLLTSMATSTFKCLLTGRHKLQKHHSLSSSTETPMDHFNLSKPVVPISVSTPTHNTGFTISGSPTTHSSASSVSSGDGNVHHDRI